MSSKVQTALFHCNFCNEKPNNIKELMVHKKKEHLEKVSLCWKYSSGTCEFGDLNWFSHSGTTPESSFIKCKVCDETFPLLPEYLRHKKNSHTHLVPTCKNNFNGECKYGEIYCWFKHEKKEVSENDTIEKNEVVQKIFEVMEKITERITKLEK